MNGLQVSASGISATEVCNQAVFIAPNGDDATGDGSQIKPYRGILRAHQAIGSRSGTVFLQAGEYDMGSLVIPVRLNPRRRGITIRPFDSREKVLLKSTVDGPFFLKIDDANVTLTDLRIQAKAENIIVVGPNADNLSVSNCLLDQRGASSSRTVAISVSANSGAFPSVINIRNNVTIGSSFSVLNIAGKADQVHFIHNICHMASGQRGLSVGADDYSGIIVNDNTFIYGSNTLPNPVLAFTGKGQGTRINLNCFGTSRLLSASQVSNRFHTNSLSGLNIAFKDFRSTAGDAGQPSRGACFDIFTQEKMGVMKP